MDAKQFKNEMRKGVVLVCFGATWCDPCKVQKSILNHLSKKYHTKASILMMNVDENEELARSLVIHSIPTTILFKNGKEFKRLVGTQTEYKFATLLDDLLKN